MGASQQDRMLDLLDHAYEVSGDVDRFDALLDAARAYFFDTPANDTLSPSVPRYAGLNPYIERHIPRLENLMQKTIGRSNLGLSLDHHAQLTLSETGQVNDINEQACALLGDALQYTELRLSHGSVNILRELLKEMKTDAAALERVVYLQSDHDHPISVFALCRVVNGVGTERRLHINLSQFTWTEAIFASLQEALGLSASEGEILRGTLKGLTQKEIAAARNRSVDTIKSQAKAVLRKAGCRKMDDLVHLSTSIAYIMGLSETHIDHPNEEWVTPKTHMSAITLPCGREICWYEYGPISGTPVLFIHGFNLGPYFMPSMLQGLDTNKIRLIAPCRPGFGYSAASLSREDYDNTVISDTQAVLTHLDISAPLVMIGHQGGVSHAFRIARVLKDQVNSMIMVGAGIPITPDHITHMDRHSQLSAIATRHAPSIMKLTISMGIKSYRKRGALAFLQRNFAEGTPDHKSLSHPDMLRLQKWGCYHIAEQGPETFMRDGFAAMADWTADFDAVTCRQSWIHGAQCPVMGAEFVRDYVTGKTGYPVTLVPDTGFNILYQRPDVVMAQLIKDCKKL